MKIYVVEDELFQLEDMMITLEELGHECVGSSDNPLEIIDALDGLEVDVVLMDIHLPQDRMGIQLARQVKAKYQLPIIFTSSDISDEVITEAIDIEPEAYLVKPVNEADLKAALILVERKKTPKSTKEGNAESFFVKKGSKLVKVQASEIMHAFADFKNYTSFIDIDGNKYTIRNSITKFLNQLDANVFVQVHKSHIINLSHVEYFHEGNQVVGLKNKLEVGVGRSYKKALLERMEIL